MGAVVSKTNTNMISAFDLLKTAAEQKGLVLMGGCEDEFNNYRVVLSLPIKTYTLDAGLLAILSCEYNIVLQARSDCQYDTVTLVDKTAYVPTPGWDRSNYWNFKRKNGHFDLEISLSCALSLHPERQEVVLTVRAHSNFLSPCDFLPNFHMFKALTKSDSNSSDLARKLISNDEGYLPVSFAELGFDGIMRLSQLFDQFTNKNHEIEDLGKRIDVFSPIPLTIHQPASKDRYVVKDDQVAILEGWNSQLKNYQRKLQRV